MGTPDYIAPEQVRGSPGDERTDIYSLGAMLYEMAVGRPPFEGPTAFKIMQARLRSDPPAPRKMNPEVSPQVEEIILRAMAFEAKDRYPSAAALAADLDNSQRVPVTGRAARLRRRGPLRLHSLHSRPMRAAVVLLILLAVTAVLMLRAMRKI
ncbi:MAG: protein kinase [Planctomycetota bacterium]|nr:protein kinase [Planctomycetota bacterium]